MKTRHPRGAALITVLAVVVLASILVVGLTVAMRMDRQASYYHLERERATLMAREAVEIARSQLRAATGSNDLSWVSLPGRIVTPLQTFELSSGNGTLGGTGIYASANLNRQTWQGNDRILDPQGGDLPLQWVYVRKDGSRETSQNPTIQSNNPIVGRYAYWVDDESTRINVNTAWQRQGNPNTNTLAASSLVSLSALGLTSVQALQIYDAARNRPFNTPFEALSAPGLTNNSLFSNRFLITHYTQDSQLNPWGEPKIVLTTQKNLASGSTNFLDILNVDNTDPGITANVNNAKVIQTLTKLVTQLSRTNWPYAPGSSFATKLYPADTNRVWQFAADILDYVRSAESSNVFLIGTRGAPRIGGGFDLAATTDPASIMGTVRRPMITEIGVWVASNSINPGGSRYRMKYTFELYLPPNYGIDSYPLVGRDVRVWIGNSGFETNRIVTGQAAPAVLLPGQFATVTQDFVQGVSSSSGRPTNVTIRLAPSVITGGEADIVPVGLQNIYFIGCPVDSDPAIGATAVSSVEVNDPRINKNSANWVPRTGNSFGATNSIWGSALSTPPFPPQDTDGGQISVASLRMPYPKGHTNNPLGAIDSVAEIGFINTGMEVSSARGVPWRSVRLQPTAGASTNIVPDWALLDLFSAPVVTNGVSTNLRKLYAPSENALAGRINLNAGRLEPFTNSSRTNSLNALFTNVTGASADTVSDVEHLVLAESGVAYGAANLFESVGELTEIRGIADGGEATEQSILRQVVWQSTVRGNVFSVYSIGQALKQTPNGSVVINGEKMLQTMIERYTEGTTPKYRVVYWREVNP